MKIDINKIIGTSDFRAHTAAIFDEVEAGATYLITRGPKPVALITPVPKEMESAGLATTYPGKITNQPTPIATESETDPIEME